MPKARPAPAHLDLDAFGLGLAAESDRASAVLGPAQLDAQLLHLFQARLSSFHRELLEPSAPLGSFSARIHLARALGWISDDVSTDLNTIRSIRNTFAHSSDHTLAFTNQSVADKCRSLRVSQAFLDGYEVAAAAPHRNLSSAVVLGARDALTAPRKRFELAVDFIAQYLLKIRLSPDDASDDLCAEVKALSSEARISISISGTAVAGPTMATSAVDGSETKPGSSS